MKNENQSLGFVISAAALGAVALYFAVIAGAPKTAIVVALSSIACFAAAFLEQPVRSIIEFDDDGIYDPRLGLSKIFWTEIRDFYIADGEGNRFLCLEVVRPERFLTNIDRSKRASMSLHHSIGFRRINVDVGHLDMPVQDLHRRIQDRLKRAGSKPSTHSNHFATSH